MPPIANNIHLQELQELEQEAIENCRADFDIECDRINTDCEDEYYYDNVDNY